MSQYRNSREIPQKEDFLRLEGILGTKLPEELRELYMSHNGGYPDLCLFTSSTGIEYVLQEYLPIGSNDEMSVEWTLAEHEGFPRNLFPFAIDPGGNIFCLSMRSVDRGAVLFWDHEHFDTPDQSLTPVAPNLVTFISALKPDNI